MRWRSLWLFVALTLCSWAVPASQFPAGAYKKDAGDNESPNCDADELHPSFDAALQCVRNGLLPGRSVIGVTASSSTQWIVDIEPGGGVAINFTGDPMPVDPDKNTGTPPEGCKVCNPINAATGNKYQEELDYRTSVGGPLPLEFRRYYSSDVQRLGSLGYQWTHNFSARIDKNFLPVGYAVAIAIRPDGKKLRFYLEGLNFVPADNDVAATGVLTAIRDQGGTGPNIIGWTYVGPDDIVETYNASGWLIERRHRTGFKQTLAYTGTRLTSITDSLGRTLALAYDANERISRVTAPGSLFFDYHYDANSNLDEVENPDNDTRRYHYEKQPPLQHALTGITDEKGVRYATYDYYDDGHAKLTKHIAGPGVDVDKATLVYNTNGTTTVTDPLLTNRVYAFEMAIGVKRAGTVESAYPGAPYKSRTYDNDGIGNDTGFVTSKTDFNGNVTTYVMNSRNLEEQRTEGIKSGDPLERKRTISTVWHTTQRVPKKIDEWVDAVNGESRRTTYTYWFDAAAAPFESTIKVEDTAANESRTTTLTYELKAGVMKVTKVDGPRPDTDVSDVTNYAYDPNTGNLLSMSQPVGATTLTTSFSNYDVHGNPRTITDPNGIQTTLTYNWRQQITTRTVSGAMTVYAYDERGLLDKVTFPGSAFVDYIYDDAHRLEEVKDNLGNRIHYTLDAMGNRTKEEVFAAGSSTAARRQSQTFNALGRLEHLKDAADQITATYGYDDQGNRISQIDYETTSLPHETIFTPDTLNRIATVQNPLGGLTKYDYDVWDQLKSVEDPRGLPNFKTSYAINALGDLKELNSPDTKLTSYSYDEAGNRKHQSDAREIPVDYAYDALNRLTNVTYPNHTAENVTYTYDSPAVTNGLGRLTGIVDETGTTTLHYDVRGNVTQEVRAIVGAGTYTTAYAYDTGDRLTSITYPTGRIVTFERSNALKQVTRVTTTVAGVTTTVAQNITYMPFGGVKSYALGNGIVTTRSHDADYRIYNVLDWGSAQVQNFNLHRHPDLRGNVLSVENISEPTRFSNYTYDEMSRLKSSDDESGFRSFVYDEPGAYQGVGNRKTQTFTPSGGSPSTEAYQYEATSHRLDYIVDGPDFTYDNAGNVTAKDSLSLTYNHAGRASVIGPVENTYNAAGQRVIKKAGGQTLVFFYDRQGHLISEVITPGPVIQREYVWLGDLPLAMETTALGPEYIVDNGDPGYSTIGTWTTSTTPSGFEGADYATHGYMATSIRDESTPGNSSTGTWTYIDNTQANEQGYMKSCTTSSPTFTWNVPNLQPGNYKVYAYWVTPPSAASGVTYQVIHTGGSTSYPKSQTSGGGVWQLLGTHTFGTSGQVKLSRNGSGCVAADAVKFEPVESATWASPGPQTYQVYAKWPASAAHTTTATYRITHAGVTQDFPKNQRLNGGTWNQLGTTPFTFNSTASQGVTLLVNSGATVAADAVRFKQVANQRTLIYYHLDHLGTPQKATSSTQQVVWAARYDAFGEATLLINDVFQPLRFPGQYFDAETGLHQNWNRDYDPSIGRYLQSDPIGLRGGLSTYGYVGQNPVRFVDPRGLKVQIVGHIAADPLGTATNPDSYHLALYLEPDCPCDGISPTTLGGQKSGDTLVGAKNYPGDSPKNSTMQPITVTPPSGMSDCDFIKALIRAADSYKDNLPYSFPNFDWRPGFSDGSMDPGKYNSNSYVSGLLSAAGARPPNVGGQDFQVPGYANPIPKP